MNRPDPMSFIANNYTPMAGSAMVGGGTNLSALVGLLPGLGSDINGKTRTNYNGGWDIGAYQH